MSDHKREHRRRQARIHWDPPGPVPPGACGDLDLEPGPDETLDCVCGHWRIFQRRKGHRFSTDDFLCAWYAAHCARSMDPRPSDYLDLGTGIGSVALMVSWLLPDVQTVGVEAQTVSAALARRSIRYNGIADRFEMIEGDLRDAVPSDRSFDLITGSPPYLPIGTGLQSQTAQRAPARFVHRGDVTDYACAASEALRPGGLFVLVYAAYRPEDVPAAAAAAGLHIHTRLTVVPKTGKAPLLDLFSLGHPDDTQQDTVVEPSLTVRGPTDAWTERYQQIRSSMGFPKR